MRALIVGLACAAAMTLEAGCGFLVIHTARHVYGEVTKDERGVDAALERYRKLVLAMRTEAAAAMFNEEAELSIGGRAPIQGRAAIRACLEASTADDGKLLTYELRAASTTVNGDVAHQRGSYRRKALTAGGETVAERGSFEAAWSRRPGSEDWALQRLHVSQGPAAEAGPVSPF